MGDGPNDGGLSRKHLFDAIDASLRRLGIDYVDLYQIHRFDPDTPIDETLEALHDIVKAGKARYIGASSMSAWQFAKMLVGRRRARLDAVRLDAEPLQPRLPRGGARDDAALPRGRHRRDSVESRWRAASSPATAAARIAATRRAPRPTTSRTSCTTPTPTSRSPIARSSSRRAAVSSRRRSRWPGCCEAGRHRADRRRVEADHLDEAVAALDVRLDAEDVAFLEEPYEPHPVLGHD